MSTPEKKGPGTAESAKGKTESHSNVTPMGAGASSIAFNIDNLHAAALAVLGEFPAGALQFAGGGWRLDDTRFFAYCGWRQVSPKEMRPLAHRALVRAGIAPTKENVDLVLTHLAALPGIYQSDPCTLTPAYIADRAKSDALAAQKDAEDDQNLIAWARGEY